MWKKNTNLSFKGQTFLLAWMCTKNWNVSNRNNWLLINTFPMNPDSDELFKYLKKNYPKGEYRGVPRRQVLVDLRLTSS